MDAQVKHIYPTESEDELDDAKNQNHGRADCESIWSKGYEISDVEFKVG